MSNSNHWLRYTSLLFAIATHLARWDKVYHTACLALTCSTLVRHWCAYAHRGIVLTDRLVAHLCFLLCAHTHMVEEPNAAGIVCVALVLGLWALEHRIDDWARAHACLHAVGFVGITLAVYSRRAIL